MLYESASEAILALGSGLPPAKLRQRSFMALQAFIDDSGSEPSDDVFVLAGYIAPYDSWKTFAVDWEKVRLRAPAIDYFKASEAMHLRGQFEGWSEADRDKRVVEFSKVIRDHCPIAISAAIKHRHFEETVQQLPVMNGDRTIANDHPYNLLWHKMLSELWLNGSRLNIGTGPCDFVFDEQLGFEEEAIKYWKSMKAIMADAPLAWRKWMGSTPIFRDEIEFVPLQAADLYAWSLRRAMSRPITDLKLPKQAHANLAAVSPRHLNLTRAWLEKWHKNQLAMVARKSAEDPTIKWSYPSSDPAATRRKARQAAKSKAKRDLKASRKDKWKRPPNDKKP